MNCTKCGKPLNQGDQFCLGCGTPVNNLNPTSVVSSSVNTPVGDSVTAVSNNKSKLLKIIVICLLLLIIIGILIYGFVFGNTEKKEEVHEPLKGTRTFMIYIIGSNLESNYGAATSDIKEMLNSNFNQDDMNIVIYVGGSKKWHNNTISPDENAIYELKDGGLTKVKTFERKSMSNPDTLTEFINYVYDNYKTDLYDLVLWDHGGGPLSGYGQDEYSPMSLMSLPKIKQALQNSKANGQKLEMLGFDACLMGSLDIAYYLKDYANYYIASEEIEPGKGWDYKFLGTITKDSDSVVLGTNIIDYFFEHNKRESISLSLIDLNQIDNLVNSTSNLFNKIYGTINSDSYSDVSRSVSKSTVYGNVGDSSQSYDLVDLATLVAIMNDSNSDNLTEFNEAYQKTVLYSKTNMEYTTGLSVYFPTINKKKAGNYLNLYKSVVFSTDYYNFLEKYYELMSTSPMVSQGGYKGLTPTLDDNKISVELPDDLLENYQSAEYYILRKIGDNKYMPVYVVGNVEVNGNILSAENNEKQFIAFNGEGTDPSWVTAFLVESNSKYSLYRMPALIEKTDEDGELLILNINVYYKVELGKNEGEIAYIRVPGDSETGLAGKYSVDLNEWDTIKFFNYNRKLYDEFGNLLSEMIPYDDYILSVFNLKDGLQIKPVDLNYDLGELQSTNITTGNSTTYTDIEFYYLFNVIDTQGNNHYFDLLKVEK